MHALRESLQTDNQESRVNLSSEAVEKVKQATEILHTVQVDNQAVTDLLHQRLQVILWFWSLALVYQHIFSHVISSGIHGGR